MFLYTKDEISEKENKETVSFIMAPKAMEYLGIILTKDVKHLYTKNYKTLMKEIEEGKNKRKDIPCSWIGKLNIVLNSSYFLKPSIDSVKSL